MDHNKMPFKMMMLTKCVNAWMRPEVYYENDSVQGNRLKEPCVIICNHMRAADGCIPKFLFPRDEVASLMAEDIMAWPIINGLARSFGCIPINRRRPSAQWLKESLIRLNNGDSVAIFPEGTTLKDPKIVDFKPGFVMLAKKANVKILPVALSGPYRSFQKNQLRIMVGTPTALAINGTTKEELQRECRRFRSIVCGMHAQLNALDHVNGQAHCCPKRA